MTAHPPPADETYGWLSRFDPTYVSLQEPVRRYIWDPPDPALGIAVREMLASVVLAARGYPSIRAHYERSLRHGATVRQLFEALVAAADVGGRGVTEFGLTHLQAVAATLGASLDVRLPDAAECEELAASSGAGSRPPRRVADLDPEARRSGALPEWVADLAAASVAAFLHAPGVDRHLRAAYRHGASLRQLVEAMQTIAVPGGAPALHHALTSLVDIHRSEQGEEHSG